MHRVLRIFHFVDKLAILCIKPVIVFLSLLIAGGFSAGVFMRSVLDAPMFGLEEVILFSVMWLYMLGAVLASQERTHLSADFVSVLTKRPQIRTACRALASVISLAMALFFVSWSYDLLVWGLKKQQTTPVFQIPMFISQGSLFVASLFFVLYLTRDLLSDLLLLCGVQSEQDLH
ncbi:MAG: TRAP transporter small permease [Pseudomonadales bacterium]